jgi:hypothetical protein
VQGLTPCARLAGGGDLKNVSAGKRNAARQDCYRICVHMTQAVLILVVASHRHYMTNGHH